MVRTTKASWVQMQFWVSVWLVRGRPLQPMCVKALAVAGLALKIGEKGIPLYEHIRRLSKVPKPYTMPVPFFNVLNGGVHSGNTMAFQEFMIAPVGAKSMNQAVRMGSEVYQKLKEVIKEKYGSSGNVHTPPLGQVKLLIEVKLLE